MTPAEQLRRASETLREMAEEATGNRWNVDYLNEIVAVQGDELYQVLPVSDTIKQADAALIALMDPDLARMLAAWLSMSADHATGRGREWCGSCLDHALALAEHINGRTS